MDLSGLNINKKYKLIKKINEGRTSSFYLTYRTDKQAEPLVIKILEDAFTSKKTEDIIRFKHELSIISKLEHPNIVRIYDTGEIFKLHYIAMEYIRGPSLSEILKNTSLPVELIIDIIIQICKALDCIHQNGLIHRDLKPGNIIIDRKSTTTDLAIKLADCGIAHLKDLSALMTKSEDVHDFFEYFPPEQSGLGKMQMDERSDLYSLGVIFYQLLSARLPFTGDDLLSLLHKNTMHTPPPPSRSNPSVPSIFDQIVLKLLEKEAKNRYQSARGLLSDLERYKSGDREFTPALNDAAAKLSYRTKLVGRHKELNKLKRIFDQVRRGKGGVCLINGEAGIGKTRLIEELRDYIHFEYAVFIQTKCFSVENKEPYKLLKDALNKYLQIFSSYPDKKKKKVRDKVGAAVGMLGEVILKLNPRMKEIMGQCPSMIELEPEKENARFLTVASRFFLSLSSIEDGLVLSIDDLQWCDEATLELLTEMAVDASKAPLLLLGTYRHNEITERHGLVKFIKDANKNENLVTEITIELFDASAMNMFISGLLYENVITVREISDFVHQKSKGNPFFAIEILKQLVNEKTVCYKNGNWTIDYNLLCQTKIPATIIDMLIKRILLLNQREAAVIGYAAVIGKSFEIELLFHLFNEFNKNELVTIIDNCIQLQLVDKDINVTNRLSFVHDRIQEAFDRNIDTAVKKVMHERIAKTLEEMNAANKNEVLFELAHHYIESGNKDKSFEYAYPASFKSAENFANEDALRYFNISVKLLNERISNGDVNAHPLWIRSKEGMAQIYLRIGRYDDAIDIFNELLPFMDNDISRALVLRNISTAYNKKGDWENCEKYAKIGIDMLGGNLPVERSSVIISLIKELFVHCFHLLLPGFFITKKRNPKARKKIIQGIYYESLIYTYILSDRLKYVRAVLKILNQVESYSLGGRGFAKTLCGYGTLLMSFTRFKQALKYYYKSLIISNKTNDQLYTARSYQLLGFCYEWQGEYGKAIENYNKAVDAYIRIGDSNGIGITLNGLSNIYFLIADFHNLKATNDKFFEIAKKSNDNYQVCNALILIVLYYIGTGKYDTAENYALKAYNLSYEYKIWMPHCIINILLGQLYKNTNDIERSIAHLGKAKELYEKHGFLKHYTIYLYPYIADSYIAEYIFIKKEITEKLKKFYINRIKKSCKLALRKTGRWISHYNHSLMVNAKYFALINKHTRAKKFFVKCIDHCSKLGMKLEKAKSLYEYGQFLSQTGDRETSRKNLETAYQIFKEIGSSLYSERLCNILGIERETEESTPMQRYIYNKRLSSIDRLSSKINQISDTETLFNIIIKNALSITSAQKGYLFIANDNNEPELKAYMSTTASDKFPYSQEVIEKVFRSGNPLITLQGSDDIIYEEQDIITKYQKSILSVPIKMADRVIGVCYLENSASNGMFIEDDIDLVSTFISKIAASIYCVFLHMKLESPKDDKKLTVTPPNEEKIKKVISYIKENYKYDISREGLASLIDSNHDYFGRCFKLYTGLKISEFINKVRVEEAAKKLRETDDKVIDIAFSVGFENLSTFNKTFYKVMKTIPSKYRNFR